MLQSLLITYSLLIGYGHSDFILWSTDKIAKFSQIEQTTTDFNCEASLKGFYMAGGIRTPTKSNGFKPGGFSPLQNSYNFKSGIRYKAFDVGYTYTCMHPITTYTTPNYFPDSKIEGSYWQVFVQIKHSFNPIR